MTDRACSDEVENQMRQAVLAQDGVLGVDRLKTRLFGDRVYVEVEISADAQAPWSRRMKSRPECMTLWKTSSRS